ncbi:fibronectin type III domain-containing protein [Candidatus Electronema sp. PJ]
MRFLNTEAIINNQTRGKEFEYRVIAVNKAGEGGPSSTVTAVL